MTLSRARVAAEQRFEPRNPRRERRSSRGERRVSDKSVVKALPLVAMNPVPKWFKTLLSAQKAAIAATILLTMAVFGVYSWTVYAQERWNAQYRQLENLKRQERQLTAGEESIDYNLVKNAQKTPGELTRDKPEKALFLEAAPIRPSKVPTATMEDVDRTADPLGY